MQSIPVFALLLAATTFAISNVTVTRLTDGCASYPAYNSMTGIAGPWVPRADFTGSNELNGLPLSVASFTNDGVDRFGFITLPRQPPRFSDSGNITFRCITRPSSTSSANSSTAVLQALIPGPTFADVVMSTEENWQASFGYNLSPSVNVEGYTHEVEGKRVDGVFLGVKGRTQVFLKYNWGGNAGEYYLVRLMGGVEGLETRGRRTGKVRKRQDFPVLDDRDWTGYLRVV